MAIGHVHIKAISRQNSHIGGLRNISAIIAYRSGESIQSIEDGQIKYPHRDIGEIENSWVVNNPYNTREELWQNVERAELKKNGEIKENPSWAREIIVAVPKELDKEQRAILVKDYSDQIANKYNVALDASLHREKDNNGNYHAHILLTTRNIENGILGSKDRRFNSKESVKDFRNTWEVTTNYHLKKAGLSERISLKKSDNKTKQIHHYNNPNLIAENESRKQIQQAEQIEKEREKNTTEIVKVKKIIGDITKANEFKNTIRRVQREQERQKTAEQLREVEQRNRTARAENVRAKQRNNKIREVYHSIRGKIERISSRVRDLSERISSAEKQQHRVNKGNSNLNEKFEQHKTIHTRIPEKSKVQKAVESARSKVEVPFVREIEKSESLHTTKSKIKEAVEKAKSQSQWAIRERGKGKENDDFCL